ncbi:MAG TPA: HAMP domain-containing sensor histidine kinase [Chitinophagaceae bacterium]|nr:HAMP domain-containing sensor histidine kinase [Chitinophagaceae bacterium]
MKLLTKYSLVNLAVMVVIFLLSSLSLYLLTQTILLREMDSDLAGIETRINSYIKQYHQLPEGNPLDEEKIDFVPAGNQKIIRSSELVQMYSDREQKMHNYRKLVFPLFFQNTWYKVTVAKPVEGMHHLSNALINVSLATILAAIIISVILNAFLIRRLWRPFYKAMEIMRNFKLGRTESLNFPRTTIEEFSFMNESLLLATEKAEQDYLLLKEFTENASHEMQTPLSIIRSKLDMLIQEKNLSQKQSELVTEAYASIKKLSRLNQSLLLLAKIENQQFNMLQHINLKPLVEDKILQFNELWQSRNIAVEYDLEDCIVQISPDLLDILLNNLLSNASNHNLPGGRIVIHLKQNQLVISNTGTQAALNEKKLFSRFYKESVNSNSNGLGLSIIKQIAKTSSLTAAYRFTGNMHSFILQW